MKIIKGRQVGGPVNKIPSIFLWGGCLFINWFETSWMIPLHTEICEFLLFIGVDPYDG